MTTNHTNTTQDDDDDDGEDYTLDTVLSLAKQAALAAGAEICRALSHRRRTSTTTTSVAVVTTMKSASTDLVTETDQRCEEIVSRLIRDCFPQHCIIGEESSGTDCHYELTNAPTWTIDPIDGTTNFVHGLPMTCVLIAFLVQQQPVVGVCYHPAAQEMFWAVQGRGAWRQERVGVPTSSSDNDTATTATTTTPDAPIIPCHVSGTTDLTRAVIAMDAGYGRDVTAVDRFVAQQRALLLARVRHVRCLGCCGLTLAYVAAGRLDGVFEQGSWSDNTGPKIWDVAAGKLLVQEAGGVTHDITNAVTIRNKDAMNLLERSVFAAASAELAETLLDIIQSTGATTTSAVADRMEDKLSK